MGNDYIEQKPHRFRVTIPSDDVSAIEWLQCQKNVSMSLRMLIRQAIEDRGMRDYFATGSGEIVQRPRRGRKPASEEMSEDAVEVPVTPVSGSMPMHAVAPEPVMKAEPVVNVTPEPVVVQPATIQTQAEPNKGNTHDAQAAAQARLARMRGIMNK